MIFSFREYTQDYFIIRKAPASPPELIHVQLLLNSDIYPGQLQLPHCLMNFLGSPPFVWIVRVSSASS